MEETTYVASTVLTYILFKVFNVLMHFFFLFFFVFCPGNVYFGTLSILQKCDKTQGQEGKEMCQSVYNCDHLRGML